MATASNTFEFVPIPNWPGYQINRLGQVLGPKNRILKPFPDKDGYLRVGLNKDRVRTQRPLHCLLLETFVCPCPPGLECRHKDGDKLNNSLDNICWDSQQANMEDQRRHGTLAVGERVAGARLTKREVLVARWLHMAGVSAYALAEWYGVDHCTMWEAVNHRTWKHI